LIRSDRENRDFPMQEDGLAVRKAFVSLCAAALQGDGGHATRQGVLAAKKLNPVIAGRRLGYYRDAAWAVEALRGAGFSDAAIRASGAVRRDVVDALAVPWLDDTGDPAGLLFRRNTALVSPNPHGETLIRYALAGERDHLPLDGAAEARRAGHDRLAIVEGTTDFLALRQAGATDVATSHTCAIRPPQMSRLRDLGFLGLTICYDADFAGFRGMLSAIETGFACGIDVRVARPEQPGEDVDDLINRAGLSAFRARIARSEDGLWVYARSVLLAAGESEDRPAAIADLAARFAQLAPDDRSAAQLEARFWPIIDAEIPLEMRRAAVARVAAAAQGRRLQVSPIGSLLKNRSGSARLWR
jgi:5S rRNA maturation endonuclease (ribonuclease M5)